MTAHATPSSRGRTWFRALAGPAKPVDTGPGTVLAADATLAGELVRLGTETRTRSVLRLPERDEAIKLRPGFRPRGRPVEFTRLIVWGFPCCAGSPCAGMPSSLPRWPFGSDRSWDGLFPPFPCSPAAAAFPISASQPRPGAVGWTRGPRTESGRWDQRRSRGQGEPRPPTVRATQLVD
jgi:hypothetical protein